MSLGLCFFPIKYDQKWVSYLRIECYHYCGQSSISGQLYDGALPRRIKLLIGMALDASKEAVEGVKSLAEQAQILRGDLKLLKQFR